MVDNRRFVVGINETQAPDQFEINPRLQRTRAGEPSVRQGFKLASYIPNFPVATEDLIRLKNRAVPLNNKFRETDRVLRTDVIGGLDVPNPPALTKKNDGAGIVNKSGGFKKRG